ncbi:putative FAD-linked oxidoreductase [bacterium HR41]|nr:putative FAD-linked oxidoreductase [bacterium HR41]
MRALRSAVGSANVLTDPQLLAPYERDWTGRFHGRAGAVVLPASAAEVAAAVALASEQGVPIVPQGGNTGLVGGAVPPGGGIVVSLRRLRDRG